MPFCRECSAEVTAAMKFCPECAAPQATQSVVTNVQDSVVAGDLNITQIGSSSGTCESCNATNVRTMACIESDCSTSFCEICNPICRLRGVQSHRFDSGMGDGPYCQSHRDNLQSGTYKKRRDEATKASSQAREKHAKRVFKIKAKLASLNEKDKQLSNKIRENNRSRFGSGTAITHAIFWYPFPFLWIIGILGYFGIVEQITLNLEGFIYVCSIFPLFWVLAQGIFLNMIGNPHYTKEYSDYNKSDNNLRQLKHTNQVAILKKKRELGKEK